MGFQDHFSSQADRYARYRPAYPSALYDHLASVSPARERAWDCATGNGQAAVGLARHFRSVIATDASERQIANARPRAKVRYEVGAAEDSGIAGASVDLVTVAQALHWLDRGRFYQEVRRVLRPGGVLAAWCYSLSRIAPGVDEVVDRFYSETIGPYWPPERALIESGYASVPFPFEPLAAPSFAIDADMDVEAFGRYLGTWSAVRRYAEHCGVDPLDELLPELRDAWGPGTRRVRWSLWLRLGRV